MNNSVGQPTPAWLSPLSISANCEGALLFVVRSDAVPAKDGELYVSINTLGSWGVGGDPGKGTNSVQMLEALRVFGVTETLIIFEIRACAV